MSAMSMREIRSAQRRGALAGVSPAASHANACAFASPKPGADEPAKARWCERWTRHYREAIARGMKARRES